MNEQILLRLSFEDDIIGWDLMVLDFFFFIEKVETMEEDKWEKENKEEKIRKIKQDKQQV